MSGDLTCNCKEDPDLALDLRVYELIRGKEEKEI